MFRKIIIGCIVLSTAIGLHAQQKKYTLAECKDLALKNNIAAQRSQLELEVAREGKKEAFTNFFPSVSATGAAFKATKPMMDTELPLGDMLGDPSKPPVAISMLEKGMLGVVTASQPLFAGGQIVNGHKLAKVGVEAAELQKVMSDDEVLLTVEQYFWQIATLEEKMKTIVEAKALLNQIYQDVDNSYQVGLVNKNDVLKVELKQNELESNELKLANGLKLSKMVLAQYIGISPEAIEIDNTLPDPNELEMIFKSDHESALRYRTEYQLLDKNIEANRLQLKMEVGKNLPTVAIGAGWNYMHFDRKSPMAMKDNFGLGFATVAIPISNWWGGSHAIKRQKLKIKIAEREKQDTEELLLIQMQQLWNELEEAVFQVQLSEKGINSAKENVRLNTDFYKAGTGLLSDLLDAQSALQQTHDQYAEAITNYQIKLSKYKQATGQ